MPKDRVRHLESALAAVTSCLLLASGSAFAQEPPPNDSCETATIIPSSAPNPPFTDNVDTTTATFDEADPLLTCNIIGDGSNTVWYEWTPAESGDVNITTFPSLLPDGSQLDTAHGLFVGSCDNLVQVACVDIGFNDDLIVEVEAGTTYRIKVGEFADGLTNPFGGGGDLSLTVEESPFPFQLIIESSRFGVSDPIRDIIAEEAAALAASSGGSTGNIAERVSEVPNMMGEEIQKAGIGGAVDELSPGSMVAGGRDSVRGAPTVNRVFDGGENNDNAFVLQTLIAPPDTIGDVGENYYVQMVNLLTEIFDKDGNTVLGPFGTNRFFRGLGGQCEFTNSGDPIVLYDEETKRWFISQFASGFPEDGLCIAISTTSDPTGSYYIYEFDFTGIAFPDYPKYGFTTDSISVMANLFSPFLGTGLGVIDKEEAMSEGPATLIFFILGPTEFGFIPGDNDGPYFGNTPPTFFTNNFFSGEVIDVWEIDPDYDNPENSTVDEVAKIDVTPFDTDLCPAFRERCVPQPGSGTGDFPDNIPFLEAISGRMMHRAQLRTFSDDDDESSDDDSSEDEFEGEIRAIMSHTVDADGNGTAGVRWYEMRNKENKGWKLRKENTYSPDSDSRWMGSIAMTRKGDTCLGYSISSFERFPSIGVTGRRGNSRNMNVEEVVAFDGNIAANVQRRTARWGDYSSMNIDPVDDSCWYTTEFAKPNFFIGEQFGWATKIINYSIRKDDDDDSSDDDSDD